MAESIDRNGRLPSSYMNVHSQGRNWTNFNKLSFVTITLVDREIPLHLGLTKGYEEHRKRLPLRVKVDWDPFVPITRPCGGIQKNPF